LVAALPLPPREFEFSDADFRALARLAYQHTGITLPEAKRNLVYGRLTRRLRSLGMRSFEEYRSYLINDITEELEHFINAICTNHTKFYRKRHHFEHFATAVVRPYAKYHPHGGRARIWPAGCSSGEEPHTIALILRAEIPQLVGRDVRVLATDIDTEVLRRASTGVFAADAVADVPRQFHSWLALAPDGETVAVDGSVCALIAFGRLNLMEQWPVRGPFDVIFCRNVMIYFDQPSKARLIERFTDVIRPGGWLYIGHSESLLGSHPRLKLAVRTIYQRTE
jgi:chemotaxis protein methyltransferase CheR